MNKAVTILLFLAVWTGTARSAANKATLQNLHTEEQKKGPGAIHGWRTRCTIFLNEAETNYPSAPAPTEEESEDEDNSGKEDIFHKMTSFHLSRFLQQLYDRQNALFKEHHKEIESPPPRF